MEPLSINTLKGLREMAFLKSLTVFFIHISKASYLWFLTKYDMEIHLNEKVWSYESGQWPYKISLHNSSNYFQKKSHMNEWLWKNSGELFFLQQNIMYEDWRMVKILMVTNSFFFLLAKNFIVALVKMLWSVLFHGSNKKNVFFIKFSGHLI